jgi:hypothetical protein
VLVRSVVSVAPLPANIVVTPSLSRDSVTNEVVASLTVRNTGSGAAGNVQLSGVLLNTTATSTALPNLGNLAAGASTSTIVRFPGAGFTPGTAGVLRVNGTYTGGTFASSSRVAIP